MGGGVYSHGLCAAVVVCGGFSVRPGPIQVEHRFEVLGLRDDGESNGKSS